MGQNLLGRSSNEVGEGYTPLRSELWKVHIGKAEAHCRVLHSKRPRKSCFRAVRLKRPRWACYRSYPEKVLQKLAIRSHTQKVSANLAMRSYAQTALDKLAVASYAQTYHTKWYPFLDRWNLDRGLKWIPTVIKLIVEFFMIRAQVFRYDGSLEHTTLKFRGGRPA